MKSKQGARGADRKKRKTRVYPHTVKILISVPQEIADWLRADKQPSKRVIELVKNVIEPDESKGKQSLVLRRENSL